MNPNQALRTFKKYFPSCTYIKIESPIYLTSTEEESVNYFAQENIKLSGVLNTTNSDNIIPEV